jgi:BlaI family penicillinase repressor
MPKLPPITEHEWMIMTRLWEKYPQTATEIMGPSADGKTLGKATVRTLLRRLVAKKAVGYTVDENNASLYYYFPMICEADCTRRESKNFLDLYYRNNVGKLVADIVGHADLSAEEIERLKMLLDQKKNQTQ